VDEAVVMHEDPENTAIFC